MFVKAHRWRARKREDGQTMAEYAVVLGVITAGVIVAITALSGGISGAISSITGLREKERRGATPKGAPAPCPSRAAVRRPPMSNRFAA